LLGLEHWPPADIAGGGSSDGSVVGASSASGKLHFAPLQFPCSGEGVHEGGGGAGGRGASGKTQKGNASASAAREGGEGGGGGRVLMGNHKQGVLLQVLLVKEERGRVEGMEEGEETEEEREFPKMIICAF